MADLEAQLHAFAASTLRIGAFSAASNVTGVCEDVDAVTVLLHQHGALALWDYAAGPYVRIDMNPRGSAPAAANADASSPLYKDAIFLSPHKCAGDPAPGVLVMKKRLLANSVSHPGGGTVFTSRTATTATCPTEREGGGRHA